MIKLDYYIYRESENAGKIFVSDDKIEFIEKKISKLEARKLAIKNITGTEFDINVSSQELKSYITDHLYGSSDWERYQILFSDYCNITIKKKLILIYILRVSFATDVSSNNKAVYSLLKKWVLERTSFKSNFIKDVQVIFSLL